jgi:hypothetical protein
MEWASEVSGRRPDSAPGTSGALGYPQNGEGVAESRKNREKALCHRHPRLPTTVGKGWEVREAGAKPAAGWSSPSTVT